MHDDDGRMGRVLARREVLALLGISGTALAAGSARWLGAADPGATGEVAGTAVGGLPSCVVRPAQMEGPYFVDGALQRADIRSDPSTGWVPEGVPLSLTLTVSRLTAGGCSPLPGVHVDLWQCDAEGRYSDARDRRFDTAGQRFLRGYQITDAAGAVRFRTIYPGWYQGRAVHLHFKVRTEPDAPRGREFTSQLYFDEAVTDRAYAAELYTAYRDRRTRNDADRLFRDGGRDLMLDVAPAGSGYEASFGLALQWG